MTSQTWVAVLTVAATPIAALLGFLGVRLSQRQANRQIKITTEIERDKVNASAYTEARQVWDAIIKDLQVERDSQRNKISDLEVKVDAQRAATDQWRKRLEDLERKRAGDRAAIHVITTYTRRLLRTIEDNGLVPPQPPEGLDLTG